MLDIESLASNVRTYAQTLRHNYDNTFVYRHAISRFLISPIHRVLRPENGIHVVAEDWDNLVVLDACRADLFEDVVRLDRFDDYERVESRGSATPVWGRRNFQGEYGDTVYVNANPHLSQAVGDVGGTFHDVVDVWEASFDDELGTVPAADVLKAARDTAERYPNKRLIVHFMQPHFPFLRRTEQDDVDAVWSWRTQRPGDTTRRAQQRPTTPFDALEMGVLDEADVWTAYASCLRYVMDYVWDFIEASEGKTVVTSDHGNCLGERQWPIPIKQYGHPKFVRSPELVTVPWAVERSDTRRRIIDDGVDNRAAIGADSRQIAKQLEHLGYR